MKMSVKNDVCILLKSKGCCMINVRFELGDSMLMLLFKDRDFQFWRLRSSGLFSIHSSHNDVELNLLELLIRSNLQPPDPDPDSYLNSDTNRIIFIYPCPTQTLLWPLCLCILHWSYLRELLHNVVNLRRSKSHSAGKKTWWKTILLCNTGETGPEHFSQDQEHLGIKHKLSFTEFGQEQTNWETTMWPLSG